MLRKYAHIVVLLIAGTVGSSPAQSGYSFSPDTSSYRRVVYKSTGAVSTYGLQSLDQAMYVGRSAQTKYRGLYQWDIEDEAIPDYAVVDTVQISFNYSLWYPQGQNYQITAVFRNIEEDLNSPNLDTLWARTESASRWIGNGSGNNWQMNAVFLTGSTAATAIQNSLAQDRFVLGIQASTEIVSEYLWYVSSSTVDLRVVWHRPPVTVTVDQKLSTGSTIDSVAHWESNVFQVYQAPRQFAFLVGMDEMLRASQKLISSQKFYHWNSEDEVKNHHAFTVPAEGYPGGLTGYFNPTNDASFRVYQLDAGGYGGSGEIKDPWFIDLNESPYGWRNRGDDAVFNSVNDGSYNLGISTTRQGVFQNLDPAQSSNFYNVRAAETQTVNSIPWVFWKWDTSGVTLTTPTNLSGGYYESPVIFRPWGTRTVTAQYKAHLASNVSDVLTLGGQRRLAAGTVSNNTDHLLAYGSAGSIWSSYKSGSGAWGNEVLISGSGSTHANPSLSWGASYQPVVWRSGSSGNYSVLFNKRTSGSWLSTPVSVASSLSTDPQAQIAFRTLSGSYTARPHVVYRSSSTGLTMRWSTDDGSSWSNYSSFTDGSGVGAYSLSALNTLDVQNSILTLAYASEMLIYVRDFQGTWGSRVLVPSSVGEQRYWGGFELMMTDNSLPQVIRGEADDRTMVSFNQSQEYFDGIDQWLMLYFQIVQSRDYQGNWGTATAYETGTFSAPSLSFVNGKYTMLWEDSGTLYKAQESQGTWGEVASTGTGIEPTLAVSSGSSTSSAHYAWRENASGLYKIVPSSSQMSKTTSPQQPSKSSSSSWAYSRVMSMIDTSYGGVFSVIVSNARVGSYPVRLTAVNDTLPGITSENFFSFLGTESFLGNADDTLFMDLAFSAKNWQKNAGIVPVGVELRDAGNNEQLSALATMSVDLNRKMPQQKITLRLGDLAGREVRVKVGATLPEWAGQCVFNLTHVYRKPSIQVVPEVAPAASQAPVSEDNEVLSSYPNPFNPTTVINYTVVAPSGVEGQGRMQQVKLIIYDLLGREVATLVNAQKAAGSYTVRWNAAGHPSGTYIARISIAGNEKQIVRSVKLQYLR